MNRKQDIYVEKAWKGVARNTLLEAQLHISNLKTTARLRENIIYPQWWGHEEYFGEGSRRQETLVRRVVTEAAAVAGIPTAKADAPVIPVACQHWPKRMVDENTQTDDFACESKPPLPPPSKIPVSAAATVVPSFSAFMQGDAALVPPDQTRTQSSPVKKLTANVNVSSGKVKKRFVARISSNSKIEPKPNAFPDESHFPATSFQNTPSTPLAQASSSPLTKRKEFNQPAPLSPYPEKTAPPIDGVFAMASSFLSGPTISLLDTTTPLKDASLLYTWDDSYSFISSCV